ncbi:phytoene desaturase [Alicyclobacillus mali]|uniref:Phytoene desaturase n=1 Tax=Alicyclobacillus mali (ex Roth et al. 2021) TaxID=1123961 RepID=A0ABS0EZT1_9BACL|nr:phytoene desaturase family protein [Alicyclobacillus mali (ex Roth et al. 2021)]MBF8376555.1 phytoene desaturase [Alicyclobacillus mali (ex Roth et al. 2021)]
MTAKRITVIGSGFGGLAAAVRLQARGFQVDLFERLPEPGGRARTFQMGDYQFDGGPTVVTAPFLFEELFELAGQRFDRAVELLPVDPFYKLFGQGDNALTYNGDPAFVMPQMEAIHAPDAPGYLQFLRAAEPLLQKGFVELGAEPFLRATDMARVAPDLARLRAYESVYRFVGRYIQHPFLRQCFTFHPLFIGGNPLKASAIYAMIHLIEQRWGVWYPRGGMRSLVEALVALFCDLGGRLHLGTSVDRILVSNGRVEGVIAGGERVAADAVVSNADTATTYLHLVHEVPSSVRRRLTRARYSMSLVLWYYGLATDDVPDTLAHHNIVFGPRYEDLIRDIFERKVIADDFSLYLHVPTRTDPSAAPPGKTAMYVLVPVPNLASTIAWDEELGRLEERVLSFIEARFWPGFRRFIEVRHRIDPLYFANDLNTYLGTGFSLEPRLTQSAWFRPHNKSPFIRRLYLVGAGTHPGAGIPGVLLSAKIAEKLVVHDMGEAEGRA